MPDLGRCLHARLPPRIPSSDEGLRGPEETRGGLLPQNSFISCYSFIYRAISRAISFISFISSELRLAVIYIIRVRACIASVSDCVRPHVPLYDRVYSPETAYIYQQIVPTLPDTPSASHGTTSRVLVHGSLRMSTCIAHVAPQPSVPPSDRRMPPSDPTPTRPIASERRQACQTPAMAAPRAVHPPTEPICPNALD